MTLYDTWNDTQSTCTKNLILINSGHEVFDITSSCLSLLYSKALQ